MITVSAPGKLMIMGEHAVVYGQPCIVTAIDERLTVTAGHAADGQAHVDTPGSRDTRFVDAAIAKFFASAGAAVKEHGVTLAIRSEFTSKVGFGSSSAVLVATLKALSLLFDVPFTEKELFDLAYIVMLEVQGVGSGFDIAAAIYGGTLYFVTGGKVIEPLGIDSLPLIVGYTGVKADTTTLIQQVAQKKEKNPQKVDRIFGAIAKLVDEAKSRMLEGDWERVGKLMDFNQDYLRDLGVSSQKLEDLIVAAHRAGAWGAKLSGAGGGDCMIAIVPPDKQADVAAAITAVGGQVMPVRTHAPGVRQETTDDQSELFIVVDRDDHIVGYKTRYECHHDRTLIHRTVGVLVFDEKGKLLLQKRSQTKDLNPGLWSISSSGHVRKGQSYEQAVARELQEELGVSLPLTFVGKFIESDEQETEMAALYKATSNGPFTLNKEEIDEVAFFDVRELPFKIASRQIVLSPGAKITLQEAGILS